MPDAKDFRRIVLGLRDAIESAHMGHPDFRVNGRIFASLNHDQTRGMVVLTPDQQQRFMSEHRSAFEPESGAWGRAGCTRVHLDSVDEETLGEALTVAWQNSMGRGPARPKGQPARSKGQRRGPARSKTNAVRKRAASRR